MREGAVFRCREDRTGLDMGLAYLGQSVYPTGPCGWGRGCEQEGNLAVDA